MTDYILPGLVIAFFAWRILSAFLARRRIPALLKEGAQVVDVRSPEEFFAGHAQCDGRPEAAPPRLQSTAQCRFLAQPALTDLHGCGGKE